jgi:hypothetical protein
MSFGAFPVPTNQQNRNKRSGLADNWGLQPRGRQDMHRVRREPCKVLIFSGCNSHPATGSLQPVAIGAAVEETKPSEPSRQTGRYRRLGEPTGRNSQ